MATHYIGTTTQYLRLRVDTSASIAGVYPNLTYRISWNMRLNCPSAWASINYNGSKLTFHTNTKTLNINVSLNSGQNSAILHSGTTDLGWGTARQITHVPGVALSSYYSGNGSVNCGTLTIPTTATLNAHVSSVTHNSATINLTRGNNPYNYWYVRIYSSENGAASVLKVNDAANGNNTITGLKPGTSYTFYVELWGRDGARMNTSRVQLTTKTSGISYISTTTANYIDDNFNVAFNSYSDSFNNKLEVKNSAGTVLQTYSNLYTSSLAKTLSVALSSAQKTALYTSIPNSTSLNLTMVLSTYSGSTLVGTSTKTVTLKTKSTSCVPTLTTFGYIDTIASATTITGNSKHVIQNISQVNIKDISYTLKNGAKLSHFLYYYNGTSYKTTATSYTTPVLTTDGVGVAVVDSRGYQTTLKRNYDWFYGYKQPQITKFQMARKNDVEESTYLITNGTFSRITVNGVIKNTTVTLKYRYKATTTTTWGSWISQSAVISGGSFSYNNIVGNFNVDTAYDFEIQIGDYFKLSTASGVLPKATPEISIRSDYVGMFGVPDISDTSCKLQVFKTTRIKGSILAVDEGLTGNLWMNGTSSGIVTKGTVGTWISGMTQSNAHIDTRNKPNDSYMPIIYAKGKSTVMNMGAIQDKIGFWGFVDGRTVNATDCGAWLDVATKSFNVNGKITSSETVNDSGWLNLSLNTGWTVYSSGSWGNLMYKKINGVVYLRGLVNNATASNTTIATLPVGYRPTTTARMVASMGHATSVGTAAARIDISLGGVITVPAGPYSNWLSLNISFAI